MKEFCLNNEVWNETEMKNLVKNCENIILGWENHCKNHGYDKTDAFYNFWNYAISRIKDVKQIFELILKSNDIYIWFRSICYYSEPVIISMDIYDTEYTDLEWLLLDELENFMNEWIR